MTHGHVGVKADQRINSLFDLRGTLLTVQWFGPGGATPEVRVEMAVAGGSGMQTMHSIAITPADALLIAQALITAAGAVQQAMEHVEKQTGFSFDRYLRGRLEHMALRAIQNRKDSDHD